jgi:hypothetical protein
LRCKPSVVVFVDLRTEARESIQFELHDRDIMPKFDAMCTSVGITAIGFDRPKSAFDFGNFAGGTCPIAFVHILDNANGFLGFCSTWFNSRTDLSRALIHHFFATNSLYKPSRLSIFTITNIIIFLLNGLDCVNVSISLMGGEF